MRDPEEGRTGSGMIRTGARSSQITGGFRNVLDDTVAAIAATGPDASVFVYGSVATGQARIGRSDVDLLTIGLPPSDARRLAAELSARHLDLCRGVEIGAALASNFVGEQDEAYGNRVFLRHYCVYLAGADAFVPSTDFPANVRAARGFNGDIAQHNSRWRSELAEGEDPAALARRIARKTLLAVAGLVSIYDTTWTTDRSVAVARWSEVEPELAGGLAELAAWVDEAPGATSDDVAAALDQTVTPIVDRFKTDVGLWPTGESF